MFIAVVDHCGIYAGACRAFFPDSTRSTSYYLSYNGTDLQAYAYSGEHTGARTGDQDSYFYEV